VSTLSESFRFVAFVKIIKLFEMCVWYS
jgi:hypothetical protein